MDQYFFRQVGRQGFYTPPLKWFDSTKKYIEMLILINIRMTSLDNQHFLIYKTTNLINGKIYIGKHKTRCIDDGYMGSGKWLKRAISKYGIENFAREILHECSSEEEMNAKEAELVTEEFCLHGDTYNLCVGGQGGFSYINRELLTTEKRRKRGKIAGSKKKFWSQESRDKMAPIQLANIARSHEKYKEGTFKGKTHTEQWKANHSNMMKGKQTGENNSQFGTIWITNGVSSKKISKCDDVPVGWTLGRKIKR